MQTNLINKFLSSCWILLISFNIGTSHASPTEISETLSNQSDVSIKVYPGKGDHLILWIATGRGFKQRNFDTAQKLSENGIEVWLADIRDALFLPEGGSSMKKLDGQYTAELIERAWEKSNKKITLLGVFNSAIPVLRGANKWQQMTNKHARLTGAILFSPNLFSTAPSLGLDPEYLPITKATNIPVMIYQGSRNGRRWHLSGLLKSLQRGGSMTYSEILENVTALFYEKDKTSATIQYLNIIPGKIKHTLTLLGKSPAPEHPVTINKSKSGNKYIDMGLKKFKGNPDPLPIALTDINNKLVELKDYKGKITIINFWATWCPPCVKEIPSLNRLRSKMNNDAFQLISINYAQEKKSVEKFLKKISVHFPVLLDHDGKVSSQWKVIAFPSTFVIGPDGKIHYGVNSAIYWDSPEVIKTLKDLGKIKY